MSHVLVVDDSAAVRNTVSRFLEDNGLKVTMAIDGNDGLKKLQADPGINLIILDVNMPNLDGLSMAEKVRNELGNNTVNIVMLTTANDVDMKNRGKAAGVKGWIVKPFNGNAVVDTIKKLAGVG